jgi:hypothetical protein
VFTDGVDATLESRETRLYDVACLYFGTTMLLFRRADLVLHKQKKEIAFVRN